MKKNIDKNKSLLEKNENRYIKNLESLLQGHSTSMIKGAEYLGYGILIGLFHFGKFFIITFPYIAVSTALFSILTLALVYSLSTYYFKSSNNILENYRKIEENLNNKEQAMPEEDHWIKALYNRQRKIGHRIYWSFHITLVLAVLMFLISCYLFFFCLHK